MLADATAPVYLITVRLDDLMSLVRSIKPSDAEDFPAYLRVCAKISAMLESQHKTAEAPSWVVPAGELGVDLASGPDSSVIFVATDPPQFSPLMADAGVIQDVHDSVHAPPQSELALPFTHIDFAAGEKQTLSGPVSGPAVSVKINPAVVDQKAVQAMQQVVQAMGAATGAMTGFSSALQAAEEEAAKKKLLVGAALTIDDELAEPANTHLGWPVGALLKLSDKVENKGSLCAALRSAWLGLTLAHARRIADGHRVYVPSQLIATIGAVLYKDCEYSLDYAPNLLKVHKISAGTKSRAATEGGNLTVAECVDFWHNHGQGLPVVLHFTCEVGDGFFPVYKIGDMLVPPFFDGEVS